MYKYIALVAIDRLLIYYNFIITQYIKKHN